MRRGFVALAAIAAGCALAPAAKAITPQQSAELREQITLEGLREHEQKLQTIANANQGTRAASTVGYEQSVSYAARRLRDAGFEVSREPFNFPIWEENSPPQLSQLTPNPTVYVPGDADDSNSDSVDFITFQFSAAGDASAPVVPTNDIVVPPGPPNTSNSGCEPADFPAATSGAISLIQRGTCTFVQKLTNAADAGAVGVILFNEGQPGRTAPLFTTAPSYYPVPAVFARFAVGEELYNSFQAGEDPTARLVVDATTTANSNDNVIADSTWGDPSKTVVVGGHLDSVDVGPGINDNGSGTSAIIELAEEIGELKERTDLAVADAAAKLDRARGEHEKAGRKVAGRKSKLKRARARVARAKRALADAGGGKAEQRARAKLRTAKAKRAKARKRLKRARRDRGAAGDARAAAEQELADAKTRFQPRHRLRLGLWGAEEAGLIGSTAYVAQLSPSERAEIMLNLNFDMLASPNFVRFVYDGNTDQTPPPPGGAPPGSDVIEQVFLDYFASQGLPAAPTAFSGRSDYGPFIAQGIPAGGLFSGAEGIKTPEQAAVYGGVAGEQYDPCYHEACDTFDSVFGSGSGVPGLTGNGATSLDQMSDAVAHSSLHFVSEPNPLATASARTTARRGAELEPYGLDYRADLATR